MEGPTSDGAQVIRRYNLSYEEEETCSMSYEEEDICKLYAGSVVEIMKTLLYSDCI